MRRLTIVVAVLALIYSAYWFAGAIAVERGAREAMADLERNGWQVTYDAIDTRGFPSRFDTTFDTLTLTAPDQSVTYTTPFVQAFALSYQPTRVIAAFPERQSIRIGEQTITIATESLRASAAVNPDTALSLDAITLEAGNIRLTSDFGWSLSVDRLLTALREDGPAANTYDIYATAETLALPDAIRAALDPADRHPDVIANLTLDLTTSLDRPLDRHVIAQQETDPPKLTALYLNALTFRWGDMSIAGGGDLTIDTNGMPDGDLTLTAINWRDMINAAAAAGFIEEGFDQTFLNLADTLSGGSDTLDLTLTFADGRMSLGPFPMGDAPRLH